MSKPDAFVSNDLGVMGEALRADRRNYGQSPVVYFRNLLFGAIITQEVRFPDISFYQGSPNFDTVATFTDTIIVRAGQNVWVDSEFKRNYAEAKRKGMRRGVYWFYDDRVSPEEQARIVIDLLEGDLPEMEIFADWEKTYGGPYSGLKSVVKFMVACEAGLPGSTVGMYTGYYWFRENSNPTTHAAEYDYLKTAPLWLAWYTTNPAYVLIPAPWTKLTHWQYGTGPGYGIAGTIDLDVYNGPRTQFERAYPMGGVVEPPPPPPPPQAPVSLLKSREYNSDVYTLTVLARDTRIEVHSHGGRETCLKVANETGAMVVTNGGDYDPYTSDPTGLLAVNGKILSPKEGYMPWLNITQAGEVQINEWNAPIQPYNAVALRRMIVTNGAIAPDQSAAWYEVHPKTFYGVTAAGDLVIILVDGRTPQSAGVNLFQGAQLLINAGCVLGGDAGGGGDTQGIYNGAVINVPIADATPGELRPVADSVIVFPKGASTGMQAQEALGKNVTIRREPAVRSGNDVGIVPARAIIDYVAIVPDLDHPEYKWLKIGEGRFVNYDYPPSGLRFTLLQAPPPPPPPVGTPKVVSASLSITFDDGTTTTTNLKPAA